MALPDGAPVQQSDWKPLETIVSKIVKEKQKFERLIIVSFTSRGLLNGHKPPSFCLSGLRANPECL